MHIVTLERKHYKTITDLTVKEKTYIHVSLIITRGF